MLGGARQHEVVAFAARHAGVEIGIQPGTAGTHQQAIPAGRQEGELLLPVELGTLDRGLVAVDHTGDLEVRIRRIVVAHRVDDVAVDRLVEHAERDDAGAADVLLEREVDVPGFIRIQLRIADPDFLVTPAQADARCHIAEGRARDSLVGGRAQHPVVPRVVTQVQAGQHVGVAAAHAQRSDREAAAVGCHVHAVAGGTELGVLHADTADDAQRADIPGAHRVAGEDVFAGGVVLFQRGQRIAAGILRAGAVLATRLCPVATHGIRAHALAEAAAAVIGGGGGPVRQRHVRADAQFALIDIDVAVAPAAEQAKLDAGGIAIEAHVDLRTALAVVDLLGRHHETIEIVVAVIHPLRAGQAVARDATVLIDIGAKVITVVLEARLHLIIDALFGTRVTDLVIDHRIGQAVLAAGAGGEGVFFLGAVAHALLDRIGRQVIDTVLVAAQRGDLAITEIEDRALARLGIIELAVQRAQVVAVVVIRAPIQVEVRTDALALDLVLALLQAGGEQVVLGAAVELAVLHFGVVRFKLAVLVVHPQRYAEGIGEHFAVVDRGLRAGVAGELLMAGFDLAAQVAAFAVERRGGLDQDRAADGVARHIRGGRLDHAQALGRVGGNHVQRCGAAGVFRGANRDAIHADAVEIGIQATNDHEAPLALVTGDTDARQALQRFGHIFVGVDAHGIGGHRIFDRIAAALEVDRAGLRLQLRADFDPVQIDGGRTGGGAAGHRAAIGRIGGMGGRGDHRQQ